MRVAARHAGANACRCAPDDPRVPSLSTLLAFAAGAATVFGFAPFGAALAPDRHPRAADRALAGRRDAARRRRFRFRVRIRPLRRGRVVGLRRAQHVRRDAARRWPAIGTAAFCAYLALFPAAAGWFSVRWTAPRSWQRAVAAAGAWTVFEWARSVLFSGFGWLSLGYSQLPGSPLAGYAPAGGVFAVTLAIALAAAALALAIDAFARGRDAARARAAGGDGLRSPPAAPRSAASNGPRQPARRSPCRWSRATSPRTSSSIPASASAPTICIPSSSPRAAAG